MFALYRHRFVLHRSARAWTWEKASAKVGFEGCFFCSSALNKLCKSVVFSLHQKTYRGPQIDRGNVAYGYRPQICARYGWYLESSARLKGLEEDLHMTGQQFNTLISLFYVGYVLMQIPSYVHYLSCSCDTSTQKLIETFSSINLPDHPYTFPPAYLCGESLTFVLVSGPLWL